MMALLDLDGHKTPVLDDDDDDNDDNNNNNKEDC